MKDKYTLVGFMATREPDGTINAAIPVYRDEALEPDEKDNMTWDELYNYFSRELAERFNRGSVDE